MNSVIEIGTEIITQEELIPLLTNYQLLPHLVRENIIDEAIQNIFCTEEEIAVACQQFTKQNKLNTAATRKDWLIRHQTNQEQFIKIATRNLRIKKFQEQTWGNCLNSYFLERKRQLDRVAYSIMWLKDADLAQEIYFRLLEKEATFAELAQQYSQGLEADLGGIISPVELGSVPQSFQKILARSEIKEVAQPIKMGEWIVICRLEKIIQAQLDEKMRPRLLNELFSKWLQEQMEKKGYKIEQVENYWFNAN